MRNQMLAALLGIEELDEMDDQDLRSQMRVGGILVTGGVAFDALASIVLGLVMHGVHTLAWIIVLSIGGYFIVIGAGTYLMARAWLHKRGVDFRTVEPRHTFRLIMRNIKTMKQQQVNNGDAIKARIGPFRYLFARRMLRLYVIVIFLGIALIIAGLVLLTAPKAPRSETVFVLLVGVMMLVVGLWRSSRLKHIIERYTLNEEKRNMSNGMNESTPGTGSTVDGK